MKTVYFLLALELVISVCLAQNNTPYRIFFTTDSAKIDTVKSKDGNFTSVTYTVSLDLNGDQKAEKFEADEVNCGTGGCLWTIYDGKTKKEIGNIEGEFVYILKEKKNGFPLVETYWRNGGDAAIVHYYAFGSTGYAEIKSNDLNEKEMDEYFESKPQMSDEFKELK